MRRTLPLPGLTATYEHDEQSRVCRVAGVSSLETKSFFPEFPDHTIPSTLLQIKDSRL